MHEDELLGRKNDTVRKKKCAGNAAIWTYTTLRAGEAQSPVTASNLL